MIGYFRLSFNCQLFPGIPGYFRVFLGISGYIGYHLVFGGSEPDIKVFFLHLFRVFFNHYCRVVLPEIPSHVGEYPKYRVSGTT